jgi:hypothetical protein
METYRGLEVQLHPSVDEGKWPAPCPGRFTLGVRSRYTLDRRLGEPQSWSGRCGEKNKLFPLPRIELQLHVAIPTELSRLPHCNDNMTTY